MSIEPNEFTPYGSDNVPELPAPLSAMEWFLIAVVCLFVGVGVGAAWLVART